MAHNIVQPSAVRGRRRRRRRLGSAAARQRCVVCTSGQDFQFNLNRRWPGEDDDDDDVAYFPRATISKRDNNNSKREREGETLALFKANKACILRCVSTLLSAQESGAGAERLRPLVLPLQLAPKKKAQLNADKTLPAFVCSSLFFSLTEGI